jgi:hypothetical protein
MFQLTCIQVETLPRTNLLANSSCRLDEETENGAKAQEEGSRAIDNNNKKRTPWPLVRKRTLPTERPSLVDEI